jgi:hypothetical protein
MGGDLALDPKLHVLEQPDLKRRGSCERAWACIWSGGKPQRKRSMCACHRVAVGWGHLYLRLVLERSESGRSTDGCECG